MWPYAVKRLFLIIPTLIVVTLIVFALMRLVPGDTVDALVAGGVGGTGSPEEAKDALRTEMGLKDNLFVQYARWLIGWPRKEGLLLRTDDGGATWRPLGGNKLKNLENITFVKPNAGWAVGSNGVIYRTTNGGRGWISDFDNSDHKVAKVTFIDETTGWGVGQKGSLVYTDQAIRTIASEMNDNVKIISLVGRAEKQSTPLPIEEIIPLIVERHDLDLTKEEIARVIQELKATKSGKWYPWLLRPSGTSENLRDVLFMGTQTGWIAGDRGSIRHTMNGGSTWISQPSDINSDLNALTFADPRNGWIVGEKGVVLRTFDGGDSWIRQSSGSAEELLDVTLGGPMTGWAVGKNGAIVHTDDGGNTWRPQNSQFAGDLKSIIFKDSVNGLVVGDGGAILVTRDRGFSWSNATKRTTVENRRINKNLNDIQLFDQDKGWAAGWGVDWRWGILGGDLGRSLLTKRTAVSELSRAIPISAALAGMALFMALIVAIPVGMLSAVRQDTIGDYASRTVTIMGLAMPSFWVATMIVVFPAVFWGWTLSLNWPGWDDPSALSYLAVPAAVEAWPRMAGVMRMVRATMLEVLREDYVRAARAKGLRGRTVITRHALRNAIIPVISIMGLQVAGIIGELVIIESIFAVPGFGALILHSITERDFVLIQAAILVMGTLVLLVNVATDLIYGFMDPRIRYA